MRTNDRDLKCGECHGTPRQHTIRDAEIVVMDEKGRPIYYPQHSFRYTGGK